MAVLAVTNQYQVGFIDRLMRDVAERDKNCEKRQPIDVSQMSRDEVIEHACNAVWDYVPTQGVKRDHIDFNFATTEQIKKWLTTNYSLFYH